MEATGLFIENHSQTHSFKVLVNLGLSLLHNLFRDVIRPLLSEFRVVVLAFTVSLDYFVDDFIHFQLQILRKSLFQFYFTRFHIFSLFILINYYYYYLSGTAWMECGSILFFCED